MRYRVEVQTEHGVRIYSDVESAFVTPAHATLMIKMPNGAITAFNPEEWRTFTSEPESPRPQDSRR